MPKKDLAFIPQVTGKLGRLSGDISLLPFFLHPSFLALLSGDRAPPSAR